MPFFHYICIPKPNGMTRSACIMWLLESRNRSGRKFSGSPQWPLSIRMLWQFTSTTVACEFYTNISHGHCVRRIKSQRWFGSYLWNNKVVIRCVFVDFARTECSNGWTTVDFKYYGPAVGKPIVVYCYFRTNNVHDSVLGAACGQHTLFCHGLLAHDYFPSRIRSAHGAISVAHLDELLAKE